MKRWLLLVAFSIACGGADRFDPLAGIGAVELVQDQFQFTEGPTWRAVDGVLLFSDIPANTIFQLAPPDVVTVFRADSGNANGLATDADGLLLAAEHGNRQVSRTLAGGNVVTVADRYEGLRLNSPNDVAVRSDGTVYFTDPPFGIDAIDQELSFNGVFRIDIGEPPTLTAEWEGGLDTRPNGIVLSPDESLLYVADTAGDVMMFDVADNGSLSNQRPIATDVVGGDGIAVDTGGNLFVAASDGIRVYSPDGSLWGVIDVPQQPANCGFGDADARRLYITARTALYQVRLAQPGLY